MIVVDASALVALLRGDEAQGEAVERLLARTPEELHAPHLVDIEVASALRGLVRSEQVPASVAAAALDDLAELGIERWPHGGLLRRVWALRHNLSAYDAAYVALAEELGARLLTVDARLVAAAPPGLEIVALA